MNAPSSGPLPLIAYQLGEVALELRPAPRRRAWMDRTPEQYAYRCLPLALANQHAWEILSPVGFEASWSGGPRKEDLEIRLLAPCAWRPLSHFGNGVLTFHTGYLFRTAAECNLFATGPINWPKDGISPLSGVIETDWAPYAFTMNWLLTRPGATVRFEPGEPICAFFPVPRGLLEQTLPEIRQIGSDPELERQLEAWRLSRAQFLEDLPERRSEAPQARWQKDYYTGSYPDGAQKAPGHQIKLDLKKFERRKG
jgi:hypothetical protein